MEELKGWREVCKKTASMLTNFKIWTLENFEVLKI